MVRILVFIFLALICALVVFWLSNLSGDVSLSIANFQIETTLGVIVALIIIIVLVSIFIWGIFRTIFNIPKITSRFFQKRKRDRGYSALSHGLISLGAGDEKLARKYGLTAERLLEGEPAVQLLLAQTAQMSGNKEETRNRFEKMVQDKDTKLLGLHGLYIEASRQNESKAAQQYAEEAVISSPTLPWAVKAVLDVHIANQNWQDALQSLDRNYRLKLISKQKHHRQKAVMLTALALEMEQGEPEQSRSLVTEALGLDQSLIPAAALAGRLHTRRGDIRKATKVLENSWKISPHPEIAQAYAHARSGDSVQDRWNRVKGLAKIHPNHIESVLMLAQVALEAQKFDEARAQLEKALKMDPTQRSYLLMSKLEEMENRDQGLARRWLSNAINAPRDFTWIADGVEFENWAAVSPVSNNLDVFRWEKPKHAIQSHIYEIGVSQDKSDGLKNNTIEILPDDNVSRETIEKTEESKKDEKETDQEGDQKQVAIESSDADSTTEVKESESDNKSDAEQPEETSFEEKKETEPQKEVSADDSPDQEDKDKDNAENNNAENDDELNSSPPSKKSESKSRIEATNSPQSVNFPLKHAPDDPGPELDKEP